MILSADPPIAQVPVLLATLVLYVALVRLAAIDLRTFRLPDRLTLPLAAAGLGWSAWVAGGWPVMAIAGAAAGYGCFALLGWIHHRRRGIEGLGLGDAKLLAAGGAWLGVGVLPWIVLLAACGALGSALVLRSGGGRIAFGPWLALAIAACWAHARL